MRPQFAQESATILCRTVHEGKIIACGHYKFILVVTYSKQTSTADWPNDCKSNHFHTILFSADMHFSLAGGVIHKCFHVNNSS